MVASAFGDVRGSLGMATRSAGNIPIRSSSTRAASTTAYCDPPSCAAGITALMTVSLTAREGNVRPEHPVHHPSVYAASVSSRRRAASTAPTPLGPRNAPKTCSIRSNHFPDLESRYGIEP
jgi:hypothetical protein